MFSNSSHPLLDTIWAITVVFFYVLWIWILISMLMDNFRRDDHSGWAKAGWTLLIVFLPLLGVLIYIISRPKMTAQDVKILARMDASSQAVTGVSSVDELAKLEQLHNAGTINDQDYMKLKGRIVA